jgi:hypothetical protein
MRTNVIITDDFYTNPLEVRQFALSQEFKVRGNYPGARTLPMINDSIQITYAWEKSWIHADSFNTWAAVCYLTPNAPLTGGTATFRHKSTGAYFSTELSDEQAKEAESDGSDVTKWETVDSFGNVFNRLVLYRGKAYHMSRDYFGKTLDTCRLFQVFFFDTEY